MHDETPFEEAARLSAMRGAALRDPDDPSFDPELSDLNNPDIETLSEPPLIGSKSNKIELFGEEAETLGRATSPKLYASAGQWPTAVQFRVWRWENGIPVGLGAIDIEATEDDFVQKFYDAMPQPGDGRFQYRLRPVDIRGQELGKELTINISEHHAMLKSIRARKKHEKEEKMTGMWGPPRAGGDIIVNPGGGMGADAGATYAEEMGRMFEQAVEAAESRTRALQDALEQERERVRLEDARRVEERVSLAERSTDVVQKMTEKLMASDRTRAEEMLRTQKEHSGFMLNTLTSVFAQQQEAARLQSDRLRELDVMRMQQDREFFERQRQELEMNRRREIEEAERKRQRDMEEYERRRVEERDRMLAEQRRWELTAQQEAERLRSETERRDRENKERIEREKAELATRIEREKSELAVKLERERLEAERQREQMREERERWRMEIEERRRAEQQEFERKLALEREERERRERAERDRWERERAELERKRDEERREWERRETLRREEMTREAERRREEMALQLKQMEMTAQKDREHAERMMEMARLEREAQRESAARKEALEREAREAADRERQRQHEMAIKEMEMAKERDREHQERMLQLSKMQTAGGLGAITDMLGMDTPEVLSKIFGAGGGNTSEGWAEILGKVVGAAAEVGKVALSQQAQAAQAAQASRPKPKEEQQVVIQTPQGPRMIPASMLSAMQPSLIPPVPSRRPEPLLAHPIPEPSIQESTVPVPSAVSAVDEAMAGVTEKEIEKSDANEEVELKISDYERALTVDPLKRAKDAGIKLSAQRSARKAIRALTDQLAKAPESDWTGLAAEALMKTPDAVAYIEAVTVWVALAEAKVKPDLAERIVKALRESGLIPDTMPFNEDDYAKLSAKKE